MNKNMTEKLYICDHAEQCNKKSLHIKCAHALTHNINKIPFSKCDKMICASTKWLVECVPMIGDWDK